MKEKLEKNLKSTAARELGEKIIINTGKTIVTKFSKMAVTRLIIKGIPIVNVISTVWDACTLGYALFNYFSTTPPLTAQQVKKLEEEKNWKVLSAKLRDLAEEDPLKRRFVILKAFGMLSKSENIGVLYFGARPRFDVYLKFYETSATGGDYFKNPGKYIKYFLKEGTETVGAGVKIGFKIVEEIRVDDDDEVKRLVESKGISAFNELPLLGDDETEMKIMSDYWNLKERKELKD